MKREWYAVPPFGIVRSWNVVRRRENPRFTGDVEYYVSPGCREARRFKNADAAENFAEKLNAAALEVPRG